MSRKGTSMRGRDHSSASGNGSRRHISSSKDFSSYELQSPMSFIDGMSVGDSSFAGARAGGRQEDDKHFTGTHADGRQADDKYSAGLLTGGHQTDDPRFVDARARERQAARMLSQGSSVTNSVTLPIRGFKVIGASSGSQPSYQDIDPKNNLHRDTTNAQLSKDENDLEQSSGVAVTIDLVKRGFKAIFSGELWFLR